MERIVTNTLENVPPGAAVPPSGTPVAPGVAAMQDGGSLTDTLIAPMLELCIVGVLPPQPMMIRATVAKARINRKLGLRSTLIRGIVLVLMGDSEYTCCTC